MDFNDIYYFFLVAENRGFTSAEKRSGITKSLLSRRVNKLEDRLNVRLIQRNSRSFSLTSAGKILHQHAIDMVREGLAAYESLSDLTAEPKGVIKVSSPTVLAQYHLAPILPKFMANHPKVQVTLDATDRPIQIIDEHIDIAIRACKKITDEPGLVARPLATSHMIMVASPRYIEQFGKPNIPQDIMMGAKTLSSVLDRFEGEQKWNLKNTHTGESIIVQHTPILYCLNPKVQLEAAIHGIGIGLIPDVVASPAISDGRLIRLLTSWVANSHIIHAAFPSRKNMNPAVRAFLDFLVVHLPDTLAVPIIDAHQ